MRFHVGCSGFYNRHWKGVFYPEELRQRDWFQYYASQFSTLEINTTFYKFPEASRLESWYYSSPVDFQFCVKAPRLITHFKKLNECERLFQDFYDACVSGLRHKLGCLIFQFPPLFKFSPERLELIECSLHKGYKNVVEFRHESWWTEEVYTRLKSSNIIFCTPSHPQLPEQLVTNSNIAYVRMHGKEKMFYSKYTDAELRNLALDLQSRKELDEAWIFFNNTASTAGIENALAFKNILPQSV